MVESMLSTPSLPLEDSSSERPTLAAVARAANVSLATASYAIRGDPKISGATRQRICAIAKRIGYTPNPELGRLMFLLRDRHRPQIKATLAVLTLKGNSTVLGEFGGELRRGMRERAEALGFALDTVEVDPTQMGRARVTQILASRGVRGVILGPLAEAVDCRDLLDWDQFSAVAVTNLVRSPSLARVTPHYFQIAELALRRLAGAGYRRVAWVGRGASEESAGALSLAAHSLAQRGVGVDLVSLPPGVCADEIAAQLRRSDVDALLVPDAKAAEEVAGIGRAADVGRLICALDVPSGGRWSGVIQKPRAVGQLALEALARQIQVGERGSASGAAVTMIEGVWTDAAPQSFKNATPLAPAGVRARAS
ncbi:MAG: LacI family DNA-binding transcriptional regulator [Candidatus Didemnitutus sp.]|nr:LacI family DNA-binding transcriptional regulator [Candidatus Didemnitutus sp.]